MPYISEKQKEDLNKNGPSNPGQLNYTLTKVFQFYLAKNGINYQSINDVIGAVEAAKQEFYRRVVVPYEDLKMKANGDVYDLGPRISSDTILTPGPPS